MTHSPSAATAAAAHNEEYDDDKQTKQTNTQTNGQLKQEVEKAVLLCATASRAKIDAALVTKLIIQVVKHIIGQPAGAYGSVTLGGDRGEAGLLVLRGSAARFSGHTTLGLKKVD